MENIIKIGLPLYFAVYFGITFIARSLLLYYRTGKNPLVLPNNDSTYGIIGRYFKYTLAALFIYTTSSTFTTIPPFAILDTPTIQYTGITLLVLALIWTIIAQLQMHDSWRIGIDHNNHTALKTQGLFSLSRNPIFLGMLLVLIGLFLVTPNSLTLLFLIVSYILIQIQIRLEEDFLFQQHGKHYQQYKQQVRRFL